MARIAGVDLPRRKHVAVALPYIYGLGKSNAKVICKKAGIPPSKKVEELTDAEVKAIREASTDLDKNGRTSLFEVFSAASASVKQHYEQKGQLATERAVLDDNGDGKGREASVEGPDGGVARISYLDAESAAENASPELAALAKRRRTLEMQAEEHKQLKGVMPDAEWNATFEKLMLELAQVSAEIRKKS